MSTVQNYLSALTRHTGSEDFSRSGVEFQPYLKYVIKRAILSELEKQAASDVWMPTWGAISTDLSTFDDWLISDRLSEGQNGTVTLVRMADEAQTAVQRAAAGLGSLPLSLDGVTQFDLNYEGALFFRLDDGAASSEKETRLIGFSCLTQDLSVFSHIEFYLLFGTPGSPSPVEIYRLRESVQSAINGVVDRIKHGLGEYKSISNILMLADAEFQKAFLRLGLGSNAHQAIQRSIQPKQQMPVVRSEDDGNRSAFVESDANPTEDEIVDTPTRLDLVFREALKSSIPDFKASRLHVDLSYPEGVKTRDGQLWHAIATYSGGGMFSSETLLLAFVVERADEVAEVIERFRQTASELRDVKALYIIAQETISDTVTNISNEIRGQLNVSVHKY